MGRPGAPGRSARSVVAAALTAVGVVALVASAGGSQPVAAQAAPPNLGTAALFGVLGGTGVTNTGDSVITGDLGSSPEDAITGFPPGLVLGAVHADDAVAVQAQTDLITGYNDAAGAIATNAQVGADLVGQTLSPGVYRNDATGTLGLTGTVTLDAGGDEDAIFIFQSGSTLITGSSSTVALINGANSCNVYWQVGSSATFGTATTFKGTVMALTSISTTAGTDVRGRLLARNGAVTLIDTTVNAVGCEIGPTVVDTTTTTAPPDTTTTTPPDTTPTTPVDTTPTTPTTAAPDTGTTAPGGPGFPGAGGPGPQLPTPAPSGPGLPATGSSPWVAPLVIGALALAIGGALQLSVHVDRRRHGR